MGVVVNGRVSSYAPARSAAVHDDTWTGKFYRFISRGRVQVAIGLVPAVILPAIVRAATDSSPDPISITDINVIATVWSFLFGFLIFRKVTAFPGVTATAYILPTFVASYSLVALGFFIAKQGYSLYHLISSFMLTTTFFYLIFFIMRRARRPSMAVIEVGDYKCLENATFVDWTPISDPSQDPGGVPVVVDLRADLSPEWERFIADSALAGRQIYNAKHVAESLTGRVQMEHLSENPLGSLQPDSIYGLAKRYCDFVMAGVALTAMSPLLGACALMIRLDSPGPALFRQTRIGKGGRPFTVYKFRTMREEPRAETDLNAHMTQSNDPRITRLGGWLRARRIDELPQLINVLKGEMSWIGPRPEAVQLAQWYEASIPFYRYRHVVRPGITGWAQVNQGHVTSLDDADVKLQYDFFYVKNFSLWIDMLVLLRTLKVVATGRGAK